MAAGAVATSSLFSPPPLPLPELHGREGTINVLRRQNYFITPHPVSLRRTGRRAGGGGRRRSGMPQGVGSSTSLDLFLTFKIDCAWRGVSSLVSQ